VPQRSKDIDLILRKDLKIINTAKVLRLNANEAIVDSNSVQLPCIAEYRGKRITALEYVWDTKIDGKPVKRGIMVSGHGIHGVPTLRELDVLIALQSVFINKKMNNGVVELKTENIKEEDLYIDFTINELARELGYNSPNNIVRNNIKKSIEILVATTISNLFEGGIYDVKIRQYIKNPHVSYHYLESYAGYEVEEGKEKKVVDVTKIKISKFFYDMIVNDYKLFYNRDIYKLTKNLTARKIYLIALQWMGKRDYAVANMSTLIQRVPMAQAEPKYQKQYIKTALKNLNEHKLLKIVYDKTNKDKVYMIKPNVDLDEGELYYLDKFNTYDEVVEGLKSFGLMEIEIPLMFNIEKIRYVQALLRYGSTLKLYGKIRDDREWIRSYMEAEYPLDDKYYSNTESQ
jgi:hypothetical protein